MRRQIAVVMCSAVFGLMALSSHAIAQQKTVKACQDEWRANKAANQANGVTEKAYVTQCRSGAAAPAQTTAPAAPAPTPASTATDTGQKTVKACQDEWRANKAANQANGVTEKAYVTQCRNGVAPAQTTAPAAPAPAPASTGAATGQKTVKACQDEWRANKAANQANGVTEKAYVAQCRSGAPPAQTTAAPAPPPPPAPAPSAAPAAPPSSPAPAPAATHGPAPNVQASPTGANEFSTEAQAKATCPSDTVVWANLTSKVYHYSDTRYYGHTKHGAYMCERAALAAGIRAPKNEAHP
jgi:hypothetical protein